MFMQNDIPLHIVRQVDALYRAHFQDERFILRGFSITWPPCSPDFFFKFDFAVVERESGSQYSASSARVLESAHMIYRFRGVSAKDF